MSIDRVEQAAARARELSEGELPGPPCPDATLEHGIRVAVGDPQAPLGTFLTILDRHCLLGEDGWLAPDVALVSVGDHYDWPGPGSQERVDEESRALVAWLAAHTSEQVTLLLGNHDLSRVGELAGLSDADFARAHARAREAYRGGNPAPERQASFLERFPCFPDAESAARDLSSFRVAQRTQVTALLEARRFRLAHAAADDLLVTHAGLTWDELRCLGLPEERATDAPGLARALNHALDRALETWEPGVRLELPGLHLPGHADLGPGRGLLYHQPAHPGVLDFDPGEPPPRRRFDPRRLPVGLTQVVGHVRDGRCRLNLGPWVAEEEERDGPLRHLRSDGEEVEYRLGTPGERRPGEALMLFTDSRMLHAPEAFELLDLASRRPLLEEWRRA